MCSRYELRATPRRLVVRFDLAAPPPAEWPPELRPTDRAVVIAADRGGGRRAALLRWGIAASWDTKPLINARAETLAERRTFRPLLANRCLVPATAYLEWRRADRLRLKNRIAPEGGEIVAFAGLIDGDAFTIITCAPAPAIAYIHNRMPVILAVAAEAAWLDAALPFPAVAPLLIPYAERPLAAAEEPSGRGRPDPFGPADRGT